MQLSQFLAMLGQNVIRHQLDMKTHSLVIVPLVYALMYGFLKVLLPKPLKNRTKTGPGPVSDPGPVRFGPDPQVFSPVRSVTPGTLLNTHMNFFFIF